MPAMATGMVSTEDQLADEKVIDMSPDFAELDPDTTQFTTYTQDVSKTTTTREKKNWLEAEYPPRLTAVAGAGYANTGTTVAITVTTGHGAYIKKGDLLRNMKTDEAFWVTSVAGDVVNTVRSIGRVANGTGAAGEQILIVGTAFAQGADFPDTNMAKRTLGFNYTQIFRNGWNFSRTETKIKEYGGSNPAKEQARQAVVHKQRIETSGLWGGRDFLADPVTTEPVGFAGGADEFIISIRRDVAGPLTMDYLDTFFIDALEHGGKNKVFYVAPLLAMQISKFNRQGMGSQWRPGNESRHGVKVDALLSGAYGWEIPVIVKKDWTPFSTATKQYGGWGFLIDHDYVSACVLTDSDTKLLLDRAPKGRDAEAGEFLTEMTWEFQQEKVHSIVYGVTP
jgi:hypothetical protein